MFSTNFQIAKTHLLAKKKQTVIAILGVTFGIAMYVLMASVLGAAVGLVKKATGSLRDGRYVPFGPFLAGGGLVVLLAGVPRAMGWIGW